MTNKKAVVIRWVVIIYLIFSLMCSIYAINKQNKDTHMALIKSYEVLKQIETNTLIILEKENNND